MKSNNSQNQKKSSDQAIKSRESELNSKEKDLESKSKQLDKREAEIDSTIEKLTKSKDKNNQERLILEKEKNNLKNDLADTHKLQQENKEIRLQLERDRMQVEEGLPHQFSEYEKEISTDAKKQRDHTNKLQKELKEKFDELSNKQLELSSEKENFNVKSNEFDMACQREKQNLIDDVNSITLQKNDEANALIAKRSEEAHSKLNNELEGVRGDIQKKNDDLLSIRNTLKKKSEELNLKSIDIDAKKQALEKLIIKEAGAMKTSLEQELKQNSDEIERLRNSLASTSESLGLYKELEKQLGENPAKTLAELSANKEEINRLNRELLTRPSKEIQDKYDNAQAAVEEANDRVTRLNDSNKELQKIVNDSEDTLYQLKKAQGELETLEAFNGAKEAENNKLKTEIERLSVSYQSEINRDERLKQIQTGALIRLQGAKNEALSPWPENTIETQWLNTIKDSVEDFGLTFDSRILYAFHTALKISEWSPLTVLAGVSGTGKSELPKLYSHFGGVNFMSVPVQPNWDSQESMLGYFNAIDNVFDAQPILKFLIQAQTEQNQDNPHGLKDMMNLVLLDEMNLAHVEMYFADFLSKLEERRGAKNTNLPSIDIKLGAKHKPHKLELGRNMLFAGTMNQDETTKALSDKVLDRGVTIYFPRPTKLMGRQKLKVISPATNIMTVKQWRKWVKLESNLHEEDQKKYKTIIENINNYLGEVGKALGHRVWQSIEYFMVNHPLVLALESKGFDDVDYKKALHFAFEDQLVQKVMPKLRGIETRGIGKERCLSPIRALLEDNDFDLVADFERATIMGHGQFMWCSADYLNNEESKKSYKALVKVAIADKVKKYAGITKEKMDVLNAYVREESLPISSLSYTDIMSALDVEKSEAKGIKKQLDATAPEAG